MQKLSTYWESIRSSLWFVPTLLVGGAILLALALIESDATIDGARLEERFPRLFGAGAQGSRGMLSAIASSMITIAGVVFSITIVALALASSQYTSRILRNFMRDRANQTVLGVFVGIYAYCLVVLRTIRGGDEGAFVPSLAVLFAVLLALVGIGCLIFFIHHIASSIQAENIVHAATEETLEAIDRLFPQRLDESDMDAAQDAPSGDDQDWRPLPARRTGYIESIDGAGLAELANEENRCVRMERGVGEFVVEGSPLVSLAGGTVPTEPLIARVNGMYALGRQRTMLQDAGFGIRQIVDVALKALSPGINDTTTAVTCIDYLTAILARLTERRVEMPPRQERGASLVLVRGPSFDSLLGEAFDQIRQSAAGNAAVLRALLRALEVIADRTADPHRRHIIASHARQVAALVERSLRVPHDSEEARAIWVRLQRKIDVHP